MRKECPETDNGPPAWCQPHDQRRPLILSASFFCQNFLLSKGSSGAAEQPKMPQSATTLGLGKFGA